MPFHEFIGQEHIVRYLEKSLQSGTLTHSLLLCGPSGSGKGTLAMLLTQAVNCQNQAEAPCGTCLPCRKTRNMNHPDVRWVARDGAHIKIEQVKALRQEAARAPYEGRKKVFVLDNAEDMTVPAANSLLKLLEDPPPYLMFVLLVCRPKQLPPTIMSRCLTLAFRPVPEETIAAFLLEQRDDLLPGEARTFAALAQGVVGRALQLVLDRDFSVLREKAASFLHEIPDLKDGDVFALAEDLAGQKDLELFLDLTLLYLRDILLYKRRSSSQGLYFADFVTSIKKASSVTERGLIKAAGSLLAARKELTVPVNKKGVLGVMLLELKEVI